MQVMQAQQQRAMFKPQAALPATPMVTLRNQAPGRTMLGQQPVQLKALQPGEDVGCGLSLLVFLCVCV